MCVIDGEFEEEEIREGALDFDALNDGWCPVCGSLQQCPCDGTMEPLQADEVGAHQYSEMDYGPAGTHQA
jgi:hypothetical protein